MMSPSIINFRTKKHNIRSQIGISQIELVYISNFYIFFSPILKVNVRVVL